MLIRVEHTTTYRYEQAPRAITQILRMTPMQTDGQHIRRWSVEPDFDARLHKGEDAFGNITHTLYVDSPPEQLSLHVTGEVETSDTAGTLGLIPEKLSPLVYLRDTPLTASNAAISDLAASLSQGSTLERLHRLMADISGRMTFRVGATTVHNTAAEVLSLGEGVCQDYAHLFIATARRMGIPARYVSGHLFREDGMNLQEASHAWAEAYVADIGWIGFDAANGICPTDRYIRIGAGLDYLGAAPVRGSSIGGSNESMSVHIEVMDLRNPSRQQQQQQ